MLSITLPTPDPQANPKFRDVRGCEHWLSQLQFTNMAGAQQAIAHEVDALNRTELPAVRRLEIMEALRESLEFAQAGCARKYSARPLPLAESELAVLNAVCNLWHGVSVAYQHCFIAATAGDQELAPRLALICERCLHYAGLKIVEHYRAGQQFDNSLWRRLHRFYAYAEEHGFAEAEVSGSTHETAASCRDAYVYTLLSHLANMFELNRRQMLAAMRWLAQWSNLVGVSRTPPEGALAPWLVVDLDSEGGVQYLKDAPLSHAVRYLDVSELSKTMRVNRILLEQGQDPVDLGLGSGLAGTECLELLNYLHQHLCEGRSTRLVGRANVENKVQVCFGLAAAHYFTTGKPFRQPRKPGSSLSRQERHQLEALGHVSILDPKLRTVDTMPALESWDLQEESALGLRLRRDGGGGRRVSVGQLIAIRLEKMENFMLGDVRWLMVDGAGDLRAGVRTMAGVPQAAAVRATGINRTVSDKYTQCFILPEIPEFRARASIVLPVGWFKSKRIVEVFVDGNDRPIQLLDLLGKGVDFEHASYAQAFAKVH
ncbi:MAG: hypothetical protein AB1513_07455 [Pseudomonadota bacterium]